jgi:hypothetical protein
VVRPEEPLLPARGDFSALSEVRETIGLGGNARRRRCLKFNGCKDRRLARFQEMGSAVPYRSPSSNDAGSLPLVAARPEESR